MAADVLLDSNPSNPCCAELAEKYWKVKSQKSDLIKGFKEIKVKFERLVEDNLQLKKANEELQRRGKQEKSEEVDFSMRQKLERAIHDLQGQISSYQKNQCLINVNKDEMQLLKARILEMEDEIKGLKDLLEKEKKKSDSEMKKAESEKKKAAEAWKMVKMEKNKVEEGRKHVEIERKKTEEYKLCLEKAKSEAKEVKAKLSTELSKVDNARKRVEEVKQKANMEKARADSLVIKADEQKRLMEAEKKRANDEKVRADGLSQMLEEEKQRREEIQKKMEENVPNPAGRCDSCNGEEKHNGNAIIMNANMKVLREQLKLEKKKAKYAKRMARLEKAEKSYIMKELHILKQSFMQILSRFNMLDDWLAHSIEGTDAVPKTEKPSEVHGFILQNNLLGSNRDKDCSRIDCGLKETCCTGSFNYTDPTREFVGLPLARGSCTRPTTGKRFFCCYYVSKINEEAFK